jgi:uncharacterized membrane protein
MKQPDQETAHSHGFTGLFGRKKHRLVTCVPGGSATKKSHSDRDPRLFHTPFGQIVIFVSYFYNMSEPSSAVTPKRPRLKFIDMARSIAILLMLEGHFVHDSLDMKSFDPNNPIYETWAFIRGFTSPTFLMVTGLIFVYLLLMDRHIEFTKNVRVKKGAFRVLELLFWGYVLQPNAFHVLQCIAIGIAFILLIFGLYKLIRVIPLWIYFILAGMALFYFGMELNQLPPGTRWPENAPGFIQNMFHGPSSNAIFPIVPNAGFTMIGAAIGCWLHDFSKHVQRWRFAFVFLTIGGLCFFLSDQILGGIDSMVSSVFGELRFKNITMNWITGKVGMVFMVLGVLMIIEKLIGEIKQNLFLKIGQNTLSIYIMHMVVLYGAITGFGLNRLFSQSLMPWEAAIGAVLFILLFVVFTKYIDPLRAVYNKILATVLPWKKPKSA